jgi:hypothetical protein
MKTLALIISFTLLFSFFFVQAQDDNQSKKLVLKLYTNGSFNYTKGTDITRTPQPDAEYLYENKKYAFGGLSFAFELPGEKCFSQEFEFSPIKINYNDEAKTVTYSTSPNHKLSTSGGKTTWIETAFRYQLNHYFNKEKKVLPYIGLSPQLFYNYFTLDPATSNQFKTTEQNLGLNLALVPGLVINLKNKLALDFDLPLGFYEIKFNSFYHRNPALNLSEQKQSKIEGELIPKTVMVRIGLFYKL